MNWLMVKCDKETKVFMRVLGNSEAILQHQKFQIQVLDNPQHFSSYSFTFNPHKLPPA